MNVKSENSPVVSVCCITYNHAAFLAEAIESVLMQKTNFVVEMVIGEDCSTDATRAIALEYASRYPEQIRVLLPKKNLGAMQNLMATMSACRGEFIAFLEGDDYWTNENKLQLQVDALRENTDCSFCFHDSNILSDKFPEGLIFSQRIAPDILPIPSEDGCLLKFSQKHLIKRWFVPSASMLFRSNSLCLPLPDWCASIFSGDRTLQLLSSRHGLSLYIPRVMSTYRVHATGLATITKNTIFHFEKKIYDGIMFRKYLILPKYKKYANYYLSTQIALYANYLRDNGDYSKYNMLLFKNIYNLAPRYIPFIKNKIHSIIKKIAH
ncbi:glycosyltransferase family 2 protein [Hymenobacter sp. DG25A]|uniref:glycosyltransferase family 2 protein n=1 Tax=Hymenobacter sp. DG25A TaxID=1385663 RepID=UPI0008FFD5F9|nr:glycosyltransferase [Hymenobacter sp. DG25A]